MLIEVPIHNPLVVLFSSRALSVCTVKLIVPLTHGVAETIVLALRCARCFLVTPHLPQLCTLLPLCIVLYVQCYFSSLPYFNSLWDLPSYGCCCMAVVFVFVFFILSYNLLKGQFSPHVRFTQPLHYLFI